MIAPRNSPPCLRTSGGLSSSPTLYRRDFVFPLFHKNAILFSVTNSKGRTRITFLPYYDEPNTFQMSFLEGFVGTKRTLRSPCMVHQLRTVNSRQHGRARLVLECTRTRRTCNPDQARLPQLRNLRWRSMHRQVVSPASKHPVQTGCFCLQPYTLSLVHPQQRQYPAKHHNQHGKQKLK